MQLEPHGLGGATLTEAAEWLGVSRNYVETLLTDLGVSPVTHKYPWSRLIDGVLGVSAGEFIAFELAAPMISLAEAAAELGISAERLKNDVEDGSLAAPPMYVFSDRRRRFIRAQFLNFARSPRSAFPQFELIAERFCRLDDVAAQLSIDASELAELIKQRSIPVPPHIIRGNGEKLYFTLTSYQLKADQTGGTAVEKPIVATPKQGGIFGYAARGIQAGVSA